MITIKTVPKEFYFKVGDTVEVKGTMKSGIGKVFKTCYITEQPKGELSYGLDYEQSFPQIAIIFEDGQRILYNAEDLIEGKIKSTTKIFSEGKTLEQHLKEIIVDNSLAGEELGFDGGQNSLLEQCENILPFIKPLLYIKTRLCSDNECCLGEFDSYTFKFKSEVEGVMLRNAGIPAFSLHIHVDGYAPTTMYLEINETMFTP